jgi:hypothetical protein
MNTQAIIAVFKRNLASYFGSPAGYVFICAFLLAGGLAAFWPQEFFNANAANLDQLIAYLPHILLGFVPAITMSVWADERRQGTDELLLTLPGSDLDVVIGKYLGTVAILTTSLAFSAVANSIVLSILGDPDLGLLFANYVGIWFIGLAMLAIGMVASFLTSNLTVAFVLGVAFNAPFALLSSWDWGITENYRDFARGMISLSGISFFICLAGAMLYLCSILIGRRNWIGSPSSNNKIFHFAVRMLATVAVGCSATSFFNNNDFIRIDATVEELSKLSQGSVNLLKEVSGTVVVDAYVSPKEDFPADYVQTRANLVSILREMDTKAGDKIRVNFYDIDSTDSATSTAEEDGVVNKNQDGLWVNENGINKMWDKDLYMGLVFKGQYGKTSLDFLYKNLPVEYEVVRSALSVGSTAVKKKIGVIATDAPIMGMGGMQMMGFQMGGGSAPWEIISELRKQYVVEGVPQDAIAKGDYDALLAIQPSTFDNAKLDGLLGAIRAGVPTAIFEDPAPILHGWGNNGLTGTFEPRKSQQQGGPGQPPPTPPEQGDINKLWDLLGVTFSSNPEERLKTSLSAIEEAEMVAKSKLPKDMQEQFAPVRSFFAGINSSKTKLRASMVKLKNGAPLSSSDYEVDVNALKKPIQNEALGLDYNNNLRRFIENLIDRADLQIKGSGKHVVRDPYNPKPKIVRDEDELWSFPSEFVFAGKPSSGIHPASNNLQDILLTLSGSFHKARGGEKLSFSPLLVSSGDKGAGTTSLNNLLTPSNQFIRSPININPERTRFSGEYNEFVLAAAISGKVTDGNSTNEMNVIAVADLDILHDTFYQFRRTVPPQFPLDVDNVVFSLNVMDFLTSETDLLDIRSKRRVQRKLIHMEKILTEAQRDAAEKEKAAKDAKRTAVNEAQGRMQSALQTLITNPTPQNARKLETEQAKWNAELQTVMEKADRNLKVETIKSNRERDDRIEESQEDVKFLAVFLPPIPLLIIAALIFFKKRKAELEGTAAARVRS